MVPCFDTMLPDLGTIKSSYRRVSVGFKFQSFYLYPFLQRKFTDTYDLHFFMCSNVEAALFVPVLFCCALLV